VSKQCERPSCKELAIAAYFLDSAELMMTLENYVPVEGMQVNGLCRRHADALVVPRGWRIEDKRENVPRLFPVTPLTEKPKAKSVEAKKVDAKKSRVKPPRPSIFDELKTEKKTEEVVAPVVEVAEVELEETKAIPWSPQFDQTDDLGGVLRPKGRLLSRAFNFDDTQSSPRPQIDNTFTDGIQREPFDENDIP
jgi:hypothetical protein